MLIATKRALLYLDTASMSARAKRIFEAVDRIPRLLQAPELTDGLPFADVLEAEETETV